MKIMGDIAMGIFFVKKVLKQMAVEETESMGNV